MRIELHGRVQSIQLVPAAQPAVPFRRLGGRFFSELLSLPAGNYVARVQIMFSEFAAGEIVQIAAKLPADGTSLDRLELRATPENHRVLDDLYLRFHLEEDQTVELCGHTEANCASTLLRFITVVSTNDGSVDPEDFYFQGRTKPSITDLNCVIFGTTAVCNASCIHCPTNKDYRKGFPHGRMSLELFTKIVTELAEGGFPGWFLFGLFGEPLEDPSLEQRLRLIKQLLPQARISIATNCGVYDPGKHAFIVELADDIGVHVEAISPEIYDRLMAPLKAGRVFPKIISLLSLDKEKKIHITTPVHRANLSEITKIRAYFEAYGAREPTFTQIGNRSWEGGPWSELSLLPVGGFCFPEDLRTFVIDWDGAVLGCCLDFSKSAQLGDLTKESVSEVLNGKAWLEMFEIHRTKNWSQKEACSRCRTDKYDDVQTLVQSQLAPGNRAQRFSAETFHVSAGVTRVGEDSIHVGKETPDGIVVYGPYRSLAPGRYRVNHFLEVIGLASSEDRIELDIVRNGVHRTASRSFPIKKDGSLELDLEFENDGSVLEFRVAKVGVEFVHRGAVVHQI
jgi:radical SAM protein with 4Fe4S-binding SPASM domain